MKAILVVIVVFFLAIPSIVDFLMGKFVTVMDREHWFSFFGSYLGGGIAALITLFGIYWQLFEISKKDKLEGILSYINYVLNKNKEIKFKCEIFNDLSEIEIREELFKSFKKSFLEENFKEIFSRKEGIRIAKLIEEIDKYNEDYLKYIDEHVKLEDRIKKLMKLGETIFYIPKILLIDKDISQKEMYSFNKEKEKITTYFQTKINLLERKNEILGKIKKESIEVEKIIIGEINK